MIDLFPQWPWHTWLVLAFAALAWLMVTMDLAHRLLHRPIPELRPDLPPEGTPLDQTTAPIHYEGDTKSV